MLTKDKITIFFVMADELYKVFNVTLRWIYRLLYFNRFNKCQQQGKTL